jgi:two-component system, sensor histidine kinase and response regulator
MKTNYHESFYKYLIHNINEYVYSVKLKDGIKIDSYHSPFCFEITGYSVDEYYLKDDLWIQMIYPEDMTIVSNFLENLRNNPGTRSIEHRIIHKSGKIVWISNTCTVSFNDKTGVQTETGYIIDITERKNTEERLKESEAKFRSITESSQDGVIMINDEGLITLWNKSAERIFDYKESEIVNKEYLHLLIAPNDIINKYNEVFSKFHETGDREQLGKVIEVEAFKKNGEKIFIELSLSAIKNNDKWYAIGNIRDITEKKYSEEQIKKLYYAIEQSPNPIIITDLFGIIEYVNPKFIEVTGYTPEEVLGFTPRVLKSGMQSEDFYRKLWETIVKGNEWRGEIQNKKKNGELYWDMTAISSIKDAKGEITHYLAIKEDITQRKEFDKELLKAKLDAESATRAKSEFLANMSHEIRTPLNAIFGMSNLILETKLSEEQYEYANTINFSSEILLSIINDILDFTKIEAGKLSLENVSFDIYKTIENSIDLIAFTANKKGLEVISFINNDIPANVTGDPVRLRQVLVNLINNAVKFTEKGEIEIAVEVIDQSNNDIELLFKIRDTGIGIPDEKKGKLFKPFSQVDASTERKYGGSGLGLVISKKIVEMMSGQIGVESMENKGSTFWFSVILGKDLNKENYVYQKFNNLNILVIDDNTNILKSMKYYLNNFGCNVFEANGVDQAINFLKNSKELNKKLDFIIIDHDIEGFEGDEILNNFRSLGLVENVKIILMSSFAALNSEMKKGKIIKFGGYIKKPIKKCQLYECLFNLVYDINKNGIIKKQEDNTIKEQSMSKNILIVEDNEANQKLLSTILTKLGNSVEIADEGKKAIEMASKNKYDLILMDIQMPEMNGYEVSEAIRKLKITTPIVAVSANVFKEDIEMAYKSGMNDYIGKPYKKEEIILLLDKLDEESKQEEAKNAENIPHDENIFSYEMAVDNFMGEIEVVKDVLVVFINKAREEIDGIDEALKKEDFDKIKFNAHSIKGSAYNLTGKLLGKTAENLELSAREKDYIRSSKLYEELKVEFEKFVDVTNHEFILR